MSNDAFPPFPSDPIRLPQYGSLQAEVHVLDDQSYLALKAATFANRPLLVRGEPGVGKTQLARAAAQLLRRPLIHHVVDARTESRDLLWTFDAVSRLAEAQISGAIDRGEDKDEIRQRLSVKNFVRPGPLWWAFCWNSACKAAGLGEQRAEADAPIECPWSVPKQWKAGDGCVVLIDEIDKAESDVPNGLLEALGSRSFLPQEWPAQVVIEGTSPLVVITTNEERALPDAFIRRCLVLHLGLPDTKNNLLRDHLVRRGQAHFRQPQNDLTSDSVLRKAAQMLVEDRIHARDVLKVTPLPGQAEYLDLVRAAAEFSSVPAEQESALDDIRVFVLQKHTGKKP